MEVEDGGAEERVAERGRGGEGVGEEGAAREPDRWA